MLTLLDRYILKRLMDFFLIGLVIFTLVLFFSDALLDLMKDLQHYGIGWDTATAIIGLQIPRIIAIIIPMSALLAALMVYNGLNNQFELIAMRMSGIGLYRLTRPALILAVFSCVLTFVLHDYVVPTCNRYARALKNYAINEQNLPSATENFTYKQMGEQNQLQRLIYISRFTGNELGYTTVIDLTDPKTLQVTQAQHGFWEAEQLDLREANVYTVSTNQKVTNTTHANRLRLKNFMQPAKPVKQYLPSEKSFVSLLGWISQQEALFKSGQRKAALPPDVYVTLWEKIMVPLGTIPLVLMAVPFALSSPRKLNNRGFLWAIAIIFFYYLIRHLSVQLGEHELLPPVLAMALPVLITSALAVALYRRKNYSL